ncbi:MAG: RNA polymerase sigma factor [Solirubrobacteraceae bacterium]
MRRSRHSTVMGSPNHDATLLRAARTDPAAFEKFYARWAPPLHAWLRARLHDPEAANDLTAETFAAALVGLGRFRGEEPGDGVAWLWGIARNLLHQHYRTSRLETSARRRLGVSPRGYDVDGWDDVDARASAVALARELAAALRGLSPGQRRAIELRIVADLDFGVVAEHLNCNEPAARMRVSRALALLRSRLQGVWL